MNTAVTTRLIVFFTLLAAPVLSAAGPGDAEFFETRIRPLLVDNCYACHTASKMGGLQLTSKQRAVRGGASGPAIRPGNSQASLLIQVVTHTHDKLKMPPAGKLKDEQIADLKAWVDAGAVWPDTDDDTLLEPDVESTEYRISPQQRAFWSYQPVSKPPTPKVKNSAWTKTAVDHFILAKLEEKGIEPVGRADKRALIRRVTLNLTGLPPTPDEVDVFLADNSPEAFAKVVDRLLASPHYGERWGRHWLDLARYSDGAIGAARDTPYQNAFRYRDWVVQALNEDLPYDQFVRAQLAADLLPEEEKEKHLAALGFLALYPGGDDRVDVTTKTFLGLTVGCAQCHDHKYDPIPTKDFYSLQGIFDSSEKHEYPLVDKEEVERWTAAKKKVDDKKAELKKFIEDQSASLRQILFTQTAEYMMAARSVIQGQADVAHASQSTGLDEEILGRWVVYLRDTQIEHQFLDDWKAVMERNGSDEEAQAAAEAFEQQVIAVDKEKTEIEDINYVRLGGAKGVADEKTRQYTNLEFLDLKKWYLWRDMAFNPYSPDGFKFVGGVYYFGDRKDFEVDRFLDGMWKFRLDQLRVEAKELEENLPEQYPFIHGMRDKDKPVDPRVAIRGDKENLGEPAPRRFVHILCDGEPEPFTKDGSGRLELAVAIVDPKNPLTPRVMANRIWMAHFGVGLVGTPSNYGQLGERPTHPELLDYLAARFIESGWSMKQLHREIVLSAAYQSSVQHNEKNASVDPDNKLYWRANLLERLDAEVIRDSMLSVAGKLDLSVGGPPVDFDELHRRAIYGKISRTQPDRSMELFDFPDPNTTSAKRMRTQGPMQRLFFMNNEFVIEQAKAFAERLHTEAPNSDQDRIRRAYELAFSRPPTSAEIQLGLEYLAGGDEAWPRYAQALIGASEFRSAR